MRRELIGSVSSLSSPVRSMAARQSVTREERHNAQLAAAVAASDDAIISLGTDFAVQTWNAGAQRMFGYGEAEARGQRLSELIIPDVDKDESAAILAVVLNGETVLKELLRRHKDGHPVPVEINTSPIRNRSGRVIGISVIYRNISARRRAEEVRHALAESDARFRATFENVAIGISHVAPDGRFLRFNKVLSRLLGWPADELITKSVQEITHPDDLAFELAEWERLRAGKIDSYSVEKRDLRKDGTIVWIRLTRSCVRKSDGSVDYFVAVVEDISARKHAEGELADSETRFRLTFENAPVGIVNVATDGRWLRVNEAMCRILGYTADELVTKSFHDVTHPDDLAASVARVEQMCDGKVDRYDADKRYLRKDGAIVWGRLTASCVRKRDGSIDYFVTVVEDITARKHAEEELRKSEERFRSSVLLSPLPTLLYDDREQILALSQSWLEGSSYSGEELRRIEDWTARAYGERSGEVLEYIRRIISTEPQAQLAEMTIRTKDGRERLWTFACSALGTQSDGRRLFLCVAQDVTDRKAYEDHILFLMHEVNHRAKNMLSVVQAVARQTAAREPEDFIGRFNERIRALAANQDLLVRTEWRGVDVEELVRAQLAHFADLVGSRIAVDGPRLHLNAAAAQAIGLALHELATNAGKYGALSVDAGRVDVRWRLEGDTFMMSWTERNGPPVSAPKRRGFGSTVVDSMAKLSVGGEVELNYAPSGLMWRLSCPAANALDGRRPPA
jgi:PAS domain S-box-containing protein